MSEKKTFLGFFGLGSPQEASRTIKWALPVILPSFLGLVLMSVVLNYLVSGIPVWLFALAIGLATFMALVTILALRRKMEGDS